MICPRCHGQMLREADEYACLQCGHRPPDPLLLDLPTGPLRPRKDKREVAERVRLEGYMMAGRRK